MKQALNPSDQTILFICSSWSLRVMKSCDAVGCFQLWSVDGQCHSKLTLIACLGIRLLLWQGAGLPEVCGICASPMGMSQILYSISDGTRHLTLAVSVKPCMTDSFRCKVSSPTIRFMLFLSQQPWYYWNILELKKIKSHFLQFKTKQTLSWELLESFAASPFLELCSWQLQKTLSLRDVR